MRSKNLVEVPLNAKALDFVGKHLHCNKDDFWWMVWGCWLFSASIVGWLVPIVRWAYGIPFSWNIVLVCSVLPIAFLLYMLLGLAINRVCLLLDRRHGKLMRYRGRMSVRVQGKDNDFATHVIELDEAKDAGPFWCTSGITIPFETDFSCYENSFGELEYLYYSRLPYQLDSTPAKQTSFCPFRFTIFGIVFFIWSVGVVFSAFVFAPWWALPITAGSHFLMVKVFPAEKPKSISFWD